MTRDHDGMDMRVDRLLIDLAKQLSHPESHADFAPDQSLRAIRR